MPPLSRKRRAEFNEFTDRIFKERLLEVRARFLPDDDSDIFKEIEAELAEKRLQERTQSSPTPAARSGTNYQCPYQSIARNLFEPLDRVPSHSGIGASPFPPFPQRSPYRTIAPNVRQLAVSSKPKTPLRTSSDPLLRVPSRHLQVASPSPNIHPPQVSAPPYQPSSQRAISPLPQNPQVSRSAYNLPPRASPSSYQSPYRTNAPQPRKSPVSLNPNSNPSQGQASSYQSPYRSVTPATASNTALTPAHNAPPPVSPQKPAVCKPKIHHGPHPDSKLCQDFHWVPYPLGLMPYDSWKKLHSPDNPNFQSPFRCPVCRNPRKATAHMRKIFLVAERLTWDDAIVSIHDKDKNEQLTWEVNYELGILDPYVEDAEQVPGGKNSQANKWHPYQNEYEMRQALDLIFIAENITPVSWSLWIGMQMNLEKMLGDEEDIPKPQAPVNEPESAKRKPLGIIDANDRTNGEVLEIDLTVSPDDALHPKTSSASTFGMPTPPSSFQSPVKTTSRAAAPSGAGFAIFSTNKMTILKPEVPVPYFNKSRRITSL